jgi:hypothetical protein
MNTRKTAVTVIAVVLFGAFALTACSSAPPPPPVVGAQPNQCIARMTAARDEVLPVVEANLTCVTDADCVTVGFGTRCFDSCTRNVNTKGAEAVRQAEAHVNETICKTFKEDGCTFDVPPCAPPRPPKCTAGKCG